MREGHSACSATPSFGHPPTTDGPTDRWRIASSRLLRRSIVADTIPALPPRASHRFSSSPAPPDSTGLSRTSSTRPPYRHAKSQLTPASHTSLLRPSSTRSRDSTRATPYKKFIHLYTIHYVSFNRVRIYNAQYTPSTRRNCRVASRRRRRCVHEFATSSRRLPTDSAM